MSLRVDDAIDADVSDLANLLGMLFAQEAEFEPVRAVQEAGLRQIIANRQMGQVLVLRDGGLICGMVSLLFTVSTALGCPVATLEDMIITPQKRGTGAGSVLLHAAIDRAEQRGCGRITLLTDASNADAQRFYRKAGFAQSKMIPMRLSLGSPAAI